MRTRIVVLLLWLFPALSWAQGTLGPQGDITAVFAGDGLTGGASAGPATLNVACAVGSGLVCNADSIGLDLTIVPAGSGTANTIPLWTPDGNHLGNSNITKSGTAITITGSLAVTGAITDTGNRVFSIASGGLTSSGTTVSIADADRGSITVSGGGTTWTIDAAAVTSAMLRNSVGLSVIGRSASTSGVPADIAAAADGDVLRRSGTTLGFGTIPEASVTNLVTDLSGKVPTTRLINTTAPLAGGGDLSADRTLSISANGITDALLRQGAATSVIGRSAGTVGNVADIAATADGDVLRRASGVLGWGAIPESSVTNLTTDLAGKVPSTRAINTTGALAGGGDLSADRTLSLANADYGDITTSGATPGTTWTIDNLAVTYAKIQNVTATSRLLGRISAGAGSIEELTGTQATTLLDVFSSTLKGLAPASGGGTTNFLRADGTWAAPTFTEVGDISSVTVNSPLSGGGTTGAVTVGMANGDRGDITLTTGTQTGDTWTIDPQAVTYAKIQNVTNTNRLLGRFTAGAGVIEEATLGSGLSFVTGALSIDNTVWQSRVSGTCTSPNAIASVAANGTVTCTTGVLNTTNVSGTTNRVAKFTGTNTVGNTAFPITDAAGTLTLGDAVADVITITGGITQTDDGAAYSGTSTVSARTTSLQATWTRNLTGTFNTTSGALIAEGGRTVVNTTRSLGANTLTNRALYLTATGAQVNQGLLVDAGDVILNNSGGSTTVGGVFAQNNGDFSTNNTSGQFIAQRDVVLNASAGNTVIGGTVDINSDMTKFGSSDGSVYITGNQVNSYYSVDGDGQELALNYHGYNDGITRFRNVNFSDGKSNTACYLTGSTKTLNCIGGLQVNGVNVVTNSAGANLLPKSNGANLVASSISDSGSIVETTEPFRTKVTSGTAGVVVGTPTKQWTLYPSGGDLVLHEYTTTWDAGGGSDNVAFLSGGDVDFRGNILLSADKSTGLKLGRYSAGYPYALIEATTSGSGLVLRTGGADRITIGNGGDVSIAGSLDVAGSQSYFGSSNQIYMINNTLNWEYDTNATATAYINYYGYQGGATQFRNLVIADGKNNAACTLTGSTKTLNCIGGLQVNGVNVGVSTAVSGTTNTIAMFTSSSAVGNSPLTYNSGTASITSSARNIYISAAAATAPQIGFVQSGQTEWDIYQPGSSSDLRFYTNGSDKLTLAALTGNATFTGTLTVNNTLTTKSIVLAENTFSWLKLGSYEPAPGYNTALIDATSAGASLAFRTNGSDRMTIANNGDVSMTGSLAVVGSAGSNHNIRGQTVMGGFTFGSIFNYNGDSNRPVYIRAGEAAGAVIIGDVNTGTVTIGAIGNGTSVVGALSVGGALTVNNNVTLNSVSTQTVGVNGYAGFSIAPSSTSAIKVDGSGRTYAVEALFASTAQTADRYVMSASNSGTYNTTAAARVAYGIQSSVTATRSAGANNLTDIAYYAASSGAQVNYSFYGISGQIYNGGNVQFASALRVDGGTTLGDASGDTLTVNATSTFVNNMSANGNTTIGDANTDTLGITAKINTHVHTTGTTPTLSAGCGTGATIVGNDTAGIVTFGSSGTGNTCAVTFASSFGSTPSCTIGPRLLMTTKTMIINAQSATALTIGFGDNTTLIASLGFNYHCIGL